MAHPKHEQVRQRFQFCCGYCGIRETDAGGELTVDHYRPVTAGGDDSEENLIYACFRCNTYKGDFWPTSTDLHHGRRLLHPVLDNLSEHIRLNPSTGLLEPLTETGRFHIFLLRLNRPPLVEYRLRRRLAELLTQTNQLLRQENQVLRFRLANLENYLQQLKSRQMTEEGHKLEPPA